MIRHVSFDFDGVLAQGSNEAYIDGFHHTLTKIGVDLDPEIERQTILNNWGIPITSIIEMLLKDYPHKLEEALEYFSEVRHSPAFRHQVALYPGAADTLRTLIKTYTLSIVSGAERALIESVLGPELERLFGSIHCVADYEIHLQKPAPHMLEHAMQRAAVTPSETVYIGDAPNDLRMAMAAKVEPIGILTGHLTRSSAAELGARYILDDISEFPEVLRKLQA